MHFGSVCYCHIHADTRKKLEPSGEKGLLVGYSETLKAYKVYIPARKRIIVRKMSSLMRTEHCGDLWTY